MTNNKTTAPLTPYGEALTKAFAEDPSLDELSFKTGYLAFKTEALAAFEQPDVSEGDKEQEAFERWCSLNCLIPSPARKEAWQARAALNKYRERKI
jgi:hypothetical protein